MNTKESGFEVAGFSLREQLDHVLQIELADCLFSPISIDYGKSTGDGFFCVVAGRTRG
jgi:hypothetical protein